jgi:hypothetical protein
MDSNTNEQPQTQNTQQQTENKHEHDKIETMDQQNNIEQKQTEMKETTSNNTDIIQKIEQTEMKTDPYIPPPNTTLLPADPFNSLQQLLFGSSPVPNDIERWHAQGFNYSVSVPFGLTQLHGGSCNN